MRAVSAGVTASVKRRQTPCRCARTAVLPRLRKLFVADHDVHVVARFHARRHACERDGFLHRRGESAARDLAFAVGRDDFLVSTKHATGAAVFLLQNQADKARFRAVRFQRRAADERAIGIVQIDGPRKTCVERRDACRPCPGRRGSCRLRAAACRARRGPAGFTPARSSAFQNASTCVDGTTISKPSSPV